MPQMMPMSWFMIFIFLIFYSFFMISMLYFLSVPLSLPPISMLYIHSHNKWSWKW